MWFLPGICCGVGCVRLPSGARSDAGFANTFANAPACEDLLATRIEHRYDGDGKRRLSGANMSSLIQEITEMPRDPIGGASGEKRRF